MINVKYIYNWQNKAVNEYTISDGRYKFSAINIGASITKLVVPNKKHKLENITLRYCDYKLYQDNKYLLGCLIDYEKFIQEKDCALNYYFDCIFDDHSLMFFYEKDGLYSKVKYTLKNKMFTIEYDSNISVSQNIFFNLTGNVKRNILGHAIKLNKETLVLDNPPDYFKKFDVNDRIDLSILLEDNGLMLNINSINQEVYLTFGKYFNENFLINKKICASTFSGIGVVVGLENEKKVQYLFK